MQKTIITLTVLSLALTGTAQARDAASKEEVIGVGSGALIGAAAGGPFGFMVGAAFGALLGDSVHAKNESIEELTLEVSRREQKLAAADRDLREFRAQNDELGSEIEKLRTLAKPELIELMRAGISMDLLFRTDEADLVDTTKHRLMNLASALAALPDVSIQLDGFADERGDSGYNQSLSERRVASIREQLVSAGIPDHRIRTTAHGEVSASEKTPDSLALDRKVSMTLSIDELQSLAANP
jgi:outer membrane protein OmpA-like peptidoglycan-associated protein